MSEPGMNVRQSYVKKFFANSEHFTNHICCHSRFVIWLSDIGHLGTFIFYSILYYLAIQID